MTPLERIVRETIAAEGPMRLDRYMGLCLSHQQHGYYMTHEPFGEAGDFITAPEISQVFGELIGIWCAAAWQAMGAPPSFNLVELGPGRGTLMKDILRAAKVMPGFLEAARVQLVDTSARLRRIQKETIAREANWHDSFTTVPKGPMLLVANEFFDAIPIRQLEKCDGKWFERCIGNEGLCLIPTGFDSSTGANGDVIEYSFQRQEIGVEISRRLVDYPGAALIIDYGYLRAAPGDTLQAVWNHTHVPITQRPGESDITSHVNFEALAFALGRCGAKVSPTMTQRDFLMAMGIEARMAVLSARADKDQAAVLQRSMVRLLDESQMGNLFKVLAATSPGIAIPYPFGTL